MDKYRDGYADMMVVLNGIEDVSSYGVARIESDSIVDFVEKPKLEEAPSNLVNTFVNVVTAEKLREVFEEMRRKELEATDFGKSCHTLHDQKLHCEALC